jgi:hypothetical protein
VTAAVWLAALRLSLPNRQTPFDRGGAEIDGPRIGVDGVEEVRARAAVGCVAHVAIERIVAAAAVENVMLAGEVDGAAGIAQQCVVAVAAAERIGAGTTEEAVLPRPSPEQRARTRRNSAWAR